MSILSTLITASSSSSTSAQTKQSEREPRAYEAVWKLLRSKKKAVLTVAHHDFLPRIKRMISKEKDMDEGFKILNELEKFRLKYEWNEELKQLTVTLVGKYGLVDTQG